MRNGNKSKQRLGEENFNNQGCLFRIVEDNGYKNIVIEFQDKYKAQISTRYDHFKNGDIINPYHPNVFGVGIVGNKYSAKIDGKHTKEYKTWHGIIQRCFDEKAKEKYSTYKDVVCCDEWLLYENFYEWLHNQENFDKWYYGDRWCIDKDILIKGNKIYSPDTCCLVSNNVNVLFTKSNSSRGEYPIGVYFHKRVNKFCAQISKINKDLNKIQQDFIGYYDTPEQAFLAYKKAKESYIKQIASEEYAKGNITKQCYEAMMNYEVEITD